MVAFGFFFFFGWKNSHIFSNSLFSKLPFSSVSQSIYTKLTVPLKHYWCHQWDHKVFSWRTEKSRLPEYAVECSHTICPIQPMFCHPWAGCRNRDGGWSKDAPRLSHFSDMPHTDHKARFPPASAGSWGTGTRLTANTPGAPWVEPVQLSHPSSPLVPPTFHPVVLPIQGNSTIGQDQTLLPVLALEKQIVSRNSCAC